MDLVLDRLSELQNDVNKIKISVPRKILKPNHEKLVEDLLLKYLDVTPAGEVNSKDAFTFVQNHLEEKSIGIPNSILRNGIIEILNKLGYFH